MLGVSLHEVLNGAASQRCWKEAITAFTTSSSYWSEQGLSKMVTDSAVSFRRIELFVSPCFFAGNMSRWGVCFPAF